jgi:hypothetical protein
MELLRLFSRHLKRQHLGYNEILHVDPTNSTMEKLSLDVCIKAD